MAITGRSASSREIRREILDDGEGCTCLKIMRLRATASSPSLRERGDSRALDEAVGADEEVCCILRNHTILADLTACMSCHSFA